MTSSEFLPTSFHFILFFSCFFFLSQEWRLNDEQKDKEEEK